MLPAHVFAEVLRCLPFYDLDALFLTDVRRSDLAHLAASNIRVFDFSEFQFHIHHPGYKAIIIHKIPQQAGPSKTVLKFRDEMDLVAFVPAAFRNCIFGELELPFKGFSDASSEVAHTIVINSLPLNLDFALVEFAILFRSVKVCCMT